jgi:heme A synthase
MALERLSFGGFALRAVFALLLVVLTFNPSGRSFVHMIATDFPSITPLEAVCGILLMIGWLVFLTATLRAIGFMGMLLALALFAALVWLIISWGWLSLQDRNALTWIALVVLALILAIGMSWAHLYQRWSGQATVDDVDEQ